VEAFDASTEEEVDALKVNLMQDEARTTRATARGG